MQWQFDDVELTFLFRLGLLFCHFPAKDILRYTVLLHRVRMAGQAGLASSLAVDVDKVFL